MTPDDLTYLTTAPWEEVDEYIGGSFDRATLATIVAAREQHIRDGVKG